MIRSLIYVSAAFVFVASPLAHAQAHDDEHHIMHLMESIFETPEHPLDVAPVVVKGDFAIAGWIQDERGGRALLKRKEGQWSIHLCSGDGLKDPAMLEQAGIDNQTAAALVAALVTAESGLDKSILAKFASFEGVMMVDAAAHSSHVHHGKTLVEGQGQ